MSVCLGCRGFSSSIWNLLLESVEFFTLESCGYKPKLISVKGGCFGDFKCRSRELVVAGNSGGGLVMEKFWMQGFLVYILPEYAAGAGLAPPSFFRPDVIVACVFYEWRNPTSESSGVIPGKGGLTFCRQSRFDPAGKWSFLHFIKHSNRYLELIGSSRTLKDLYPPGTRRPTKDKAAVCVNLL